MELKEKGLTEKNVIILIFVVFVLIAFTILVTPYIVTNIVINKPENTALNKVSIGDSNTPLDYPWGNNPNLTVFTNLDNISKEDRKYHNYTILLSMKWWEEDNSHKLSYGINFSMVNHSKDANIIIIWANSVSTNPTDRGYAHINSTGRNDSWGYNTCDTYNSPFSQCNIEIKVDMSDEEKLFVTKHELGHVLGFEHSLNKSDFMVRKDGFSTHYLLSPSEIMYDDSIYIDVINIINGLRIWAEVVIFLSLFVPYLIIHYIFTRIHFSKFFKF